MHTHTRIVYLSALAAALGLMSMAAPARAGGITGIVAFGDSLTDVGNTYLAAGIPSAPPYYPGHWSNGPVWVEYLAQGLGVTVPTASLAGGTDYAWGGAETGTGLSFMGTPNIGTQVATYLAGNTPAAGQLFTLWGGANDFLNAGVTDPTVPVANLAGEITALANAGAKQFLVANLPLLGQLPATSGLPQAQRDGLNALSLAFNVLLNGELNSLQQSLGITIHRLDIQGLFVDAMANPSKYGFTNVTDPLMLSADPTASGYLFWDTVHPTNQTSQIIGALALRSVPEPSSVLLLATAAVPALALGWHRSRGGRRAA